MNIHSLIAASFSGDAADAHKTYAATDADKETLLKTGKEVLTFYPNFPGACMMMSALYSVVLEDRCQQKAYVVAGALSIGGQKIFGGTTPVNGYSCFSASDFSWDGHGWIVLGDYIVDVSLGRTARSLKSSPLLAQHVIGVFGPNIGLMAFKSSDVAKSGLIYEPQYVLTQDQVDALARGARAQALSGSITA